MKKAKTTYKREALNLTMDLDYQLKKLFLKVSNEIPGVTYQSFLRMLLTKGARYYEKRFNVNKEDKELRINSITETKEPGLTKEEFDELNIWGDIQ